MIDCLYNITTILTNPWRKGYQFRESGLKQIFKALDADQERYGGNPVWDAWITGYRGFLNLDMRRTGITEKEVAAATLWPKLSQYLRLKKNATPTAHQQFLKRFTLRVLAGVLRYFSRNVSRLDAYRRFPCTQGLTA